MKLTHIFLAFLVLNLSPLKAQTIKNTNSFSVIPLGVKGGLDESNLSSYLVAGAGSSQFICLDAGTINTGLQKAVQNKLFNERSAESVQKKYINSYFISHGHLDHTAGLILNSPNDVSKNIYAIPSVIDVLKSSYFTWKSWANFANEGDKPILNKYNYTYLVPGVEIAIPNTELHVTPYVLSHVNPYESTAFLVRNNNSYLLYLGDTGADTVEQSNKLKTLWTAVADKVKSEQLKAIFIEVSFDNSMPNKSLFGHLTPNLLMQELETLNKISAGKLNKVKIVVTHMKPCETCEPSIMEQIKTANKLGLSIVYPKQGVEMTF
jgi:cAMP phosphodiesterase